jgi:hypothetical protein
MPMPEYTPYLAAALALPFSAVQTEAHIDREICVRRARRRQMNVARSHPRYLPFDMRRFRSASNCSLNGVDSVDLRICCPTNVITCRSCSSAAIERFKAAIDGNDACLIR